MGDRLATRRDLGSSAVLKWLPLFCALATCRNRPSSEELSRWRHEAREHDRQLVATHARSDELASWQLSLITSATDAPRTFSLPRLLEIDSTTVRTRSPFHRSDLRQVFEFRGTRISALLELAGIASTETEITLVAHDGYFVTIPASAARQFPIVLAQLSNGFALPRTDGGPLLAVFPYTSHPESAVRFGEQFWCFYVAALIVGTPDPTVRVGMRNFTFAQLRALPQHTYAGPSRFRLHWPNGNVQAHGVLVRDLVRAAGIELRADSRVHIVTRVPVDRLPGHEIFVSGRECLDEGVMLAWSHGESRQPITSDLGGPVTFVRPGVPRNGGAAETRWGIFVEGIEVDSP